MKLLPFWQKILKKDLLNVVLMEEKESIQRARPSSINEQTVNDLTTNKLEVWTFVESQHNKIEGASVKTMDNCY